VVENQNKLIKEKESDDTQPDPSIKRRVLKLGDKRIPKNSNDFFNLCFNHQPSKIYITKEHFDYLMDDYDEEIYRTLGKVGFSNKFQFYFSEKDMELIFTKIIVVQK